MSFCCQDDAFSDTFARKQNFVTGIEARSKLVFTIIALLINLLSTSVYTPISLAGFSLLTLLLIRTPAKLLLLRLAMPLVMAAVVLVTQVFFYGETPLFIIPGFGLVGFREGLAHGLLIMSRVLGGVSLILLLSLSTPADKLFTAAAWFRVPRILIEIALLVYRYIFVLTEEFLTMRDAQKVRLGYHSWRQSLKSISQLGAYVILRAYDRADRVFAAMLVRGYTGANQQHSLTFRRRDSAIVLGLGLLLVGFYLVGRIYD